MTVNFYNVSDDIRVVNKTLGTVTASLTPFPYDNIDLYNPTLLLPASSAALTSNYFEFAGRYYRYSKPPVLIDGQRMTVTGIIDVLMTYASDLQNCHVAVIRNEGIGSNDVPDNSYPVDPSRVWYEGIVLPQNDIHGFIDLTPYIISVNASYS